MPLEKSMRGILSVAILIVKSSYFGETELAVDGGADIRDTMQWATEASKNVKRCPTVRKCETGTRPIPVVNTPPSKQTDAP